MDNEGVAYLCKIHSTNIPREARTVKRFIPLQTNLHSAVSRPCSKN